jgi:glycosyltransferase involved in cell wall biosynthesis
MTKQTLFHRNQSRPPAVSVIIPLKDEEESLPELFIRIVEVMKRGGEKFELVFIDDGSTDHSFDVLKVLHEKNPSIIKVIRFRRNYGKAAALMAGFKAARGRVIVTMDADLQDDPEEIPGLIRMLGDDCDLVSGWKRKRQDSVVYTLPSRIANFITGWLTGLHIHDLNCGLKAYKKEVTDDLRIYGDLYRYIPVLVHLMGFKVGEKPVLHYPRKYGHSKYTIGKFHRGFLDLMTILFTAKYSRRPLHLFGMWGLLSFLAGAGIDGWLVLERIFGDTSLSNRPLFLVGFLFLIIGIQFISIGLLGEMISRNERNEQIYSIREELL